MKIWRLESCVEGIRRIEVFARFFMRAYVFSVLHATCITFIHQGHPINALLALTQPMHALSWKNDNGKEFGLVGTMNAHEFTTHVTGRSFCYEMVEPQVIDEYMYKKILIFPEGPPFAA